MNRISDAIAAYSAAAKIPATEGAAAAKPEGGGDFASLVKGAAAEVVDSLRAGEEAGKAGIAGKADVRDVVVAVSNAELTLETVVAVRDKVIQAYNEIMRMPI